MKRASELEWLRYFYEEADFGPAHGDVEQLLMDNFKKEKNKQLPEGYDWEEDEE
jgi:hypothetical protein